MLFCNEEQLGAAEKVGYYLDGKYANRGAGTSGGKEGAKMKWPSLECDGEIFTSYLYSIGMSELWKFD